MMKPPGLGLTFVYYFTVTNFIVLGLLSRRFEVSLLNRSIYPLALGAGLIGGILGTIFNRNVTVTTTVKRKAVWLKTLNQNLAEMGFEPQSELEDFAIYQKKAIPTLFSGRVFLKFEGKTATIIGRANVIAKLKQSNLELS
ncbi:MAG: hypothetical protein AAGE96_22740 [Cyanobacteria bacterium P01_G01_bin.19]